MTDILASVSVVLGGEISGYKAAMAEARKELKGFVQAGEAVKSVGEGLTKYLSAPLALAGAGALKVGGDFQAAFNRVEAATQATGAGLESLRAKAQGIALDPKLQFSSVQAAEALESLAKNGLSTTQILGGAADASTALATATGAQLATAADITTDVMNNFGKSAQQAAGLVSNITGTTIASKFAIDDYRQALGQAGAVAGQLGVNFEDFNTALGVTSSGFSSGSDAGTSFKTFLQRLVPQSKEAEGAIKQLGLNFFDAQGKMRPLREIAGQLQQAFKGLSDQQKNTLGTKIFGADSIRTALLLAKDGVAGFDEMAASIAKVNAASQGAILNQGFVGSFEAFKSSVEGLGQAIADNGVLDFATDLAQAGSELASELAQADPTILQFGVALAGIAAGTGPVLVAVGTLGAALPALEAGFLVLSGPVGIVVAAFAALGVATAAVVAHTTEASESVEEVSQRFTAQQTAVKQLQSTYTPLLARYDELKAKSTLTAAEQEELRSIIQKVGTEIPTTVTQFDAYGKALDINTEKARAYIQRQQEIAAQANRVDLTKQREEYRKLEGQIANTLAALNKVDEQGNHVKFIASGDDEGGQYYSLTAKEVTDLQAKLESLYASRRGVGGLIDQLKGIPPVVQQSSTEVDKLGEKFTGLSSVKGVDEAGQKMRDALAKLREELKLNDNLSRALGTDYDYLGERSKILESGVKSLVAVGFSPLGSTVQGVRNELRGLAQEVDTLALRVLEGTEKMNQIPEFKLKLPELEPLPQTLQPDLNGIFSPDAETIGEQYDKALAAQQAGQDQITQQQLDFNTNMAELINQFPVDALESIGNSIGTALATGADVLQSVVDGLLGVFGEFLKKFGKQVILKGLADIAIGNIGQGLAEVAAGTALTIGGAFASASVSSSRPTSSTQASSGGRLNTSAASSTRPYNPTLAPAAATPTGQSVFTHEVEITASGPNLAGVLTLNTDRLGRVVGRR
ncbi:phage tail tape measure protein [Hymenobacter sp. BT559]|nr:phage tail tape measure protein [Hymenobacter sp. BT559]